MQCFEAIFASKLNWHDPYAFLKIGSYALPLRPDMSAPQGSNNCQLKRVQLDALVLGLPWHLWPRRAGHCPLHAGGAWVGKDVLTRLPTQRNSMIGELLPHRWQPPTSFA